MNKKEAFFIKRTAAHIETVNYFAGLMGANFPLHDQSKYNPPERDAYILLSWAWANQGVALSKSEKLATKDAIQHHYAKNDHHPEHYNGNLDNMQWHHFIEMVCDWFAVGMEKTFSNDAIKFSAEEFYRQKALPKYKFPEEQQTLILSMIKEINSKTNLAAVASIWQR